MVQLYHHVLILVFYTVLARGDAVSYSLLSEKPFITNGSPGVNILCVSVPVLSEQRISIRDL